MISAALEHMPAAQPRKRRKHYPCKVPQVRVSASFSKVEVEWLSSLTAAIARGADVRVLARSKALGSVSRKARAMVSKAAKLVEVRRRHDATAPTVPGLTLALAAKELGVHHRTLQRRIYAGHFPSAVKHAKVGWRLSAEDVAACLARDEAAE